MAKAIRISSKALAWASNAKKINIIKKNADKTKKVIQVHKKNRAFKQKWHEIDGNKIYFRSGWEANFAKYLQWQKERNIIKEWEHEPKTFWFEGIKRGCITYLPDFKVTNLDGSYEWLEVKGHMDAKSRTKIKRFRKFYPDEKLRIVDSTWYKSNKSKLSLIVPGWE